MSLWQAVPSKRDTQRSGRPLHAKRGPARASKSLAFGAITNALAMSPKGDAQRSGRPLHAMRTPARATKSLAFGTLTNAVAISLGSIGTFGLTLIVARATGAASAGHFFELVAIVTIAVSICTCGSEPGAVRQVARLIAEGRTLLIRPTLLSAVVPVAIVSLVGCVGIELSAVWLAHALVRGGSAGQLTAGIRVMGVAVPLMAIEKVATAACRGLGSTSATAVVDGIGQPFLRLLLVGGIAVAAPSVAAFSLGWGIPGGVALAVAWFWARRLLRSRAGTVGSWWLPAKDRWRVAREFWSFTWARGVALVCETATPWLGVLLIGSLRSGREAAIYTAISRVALVGMIVMSSINLVIAPEVAAALATNKARQAEDLYQVATGWAVLFGFPVYIVIGLFPGPLLGIFGHAYGSGTSGLTIMCGAMLWAIATGPVTVVLLMAGESAWNLGNSLATIGSLIASGLLLIPRFGVTGAALSWMIAIIVQNGLPVWQVKAGLTMGIFHRSAIKTGAAALMCFGGVGAIAHAIGLKGVSGLSMCVVGGLFAYIWMVHHWSAELELRTLAASILPSKIVRVVDSHNRGQDIAR